jgi:hypothetical protein
MRHVGWFNDCLSFVEFSWLSSQVEELAIVVRGISKDLDLVIQYESAKCRRIGR